MQRKKAVNEVVMAAAYAEQWAKAREEGVRIFNEKMGEPQAVYVDKEGGEWGLWGLGDEVVMGQRRRDGKYNPHRVQRHSSALVRLMAEVLGLSLEKDAK